MRALAGLGWFVVGIGVVGAVLFFCLINPIISWHHGIYAGFHYGDARRYVQQVTAENYGLQQAKDMRMGIPDVVNSHSQGGKLFGPHGQVRIFHLIGPKGVRYCVSVWGGGLDHNGDYSIKKGCTWAH